MLPKARLRHSRILQVGLPLHAIDCRPQNSKGLPGSFCASESQRRRMHISVLLCRIERILDIELNDWGRIDRLPACGALLL